MEGFLEFSVRDNLTRNLAKLQSLREKINSDQQVDDEIDDLKFTFNMTTSTLAKVANGLEDLQMFFFDMLESLNAIGRFITTDSASLSPSAIENDSELSLSELAEKSQARTQVLESCHETMRQLTSTIANLQRTLLLSKQSKHQTNRPITARRSANFHHVGNEAVEFIFDDDATETTLAVITGSNARRSHFKVSKYECENDISLGTDLVPLGEPLKINFLGPPVDFKHENIKVAIPVSHGDGCVMLSFDQENEKWESTESHQRTISIYGTNTTCVETNLTDSDSILMVCREHADEKDTIDVNDLASGGNEESEPVRFLLGQIDETTFTFCACLDSNAESAIDEMERHFNATKHWLSPICSDFHEGDCIKLKLVGDAVETTDILSKHLVKIVLSMCFFLELS